MRRILASAFIAATALSAPALAQSVGEVTVTGQYVPPGAKPMSLSRVVSYADLDLTRPKDMALLKARISYTARRICTELAEPQPTQSNVGRSCQDQAVADAMSRFEVASAGTYASPASAVVTNGPVPDTHANRTVYGGPRSTAGRVTAAAGD